MKTHEQILADARKDLEKLCEFLNENRFNVTTRLLSSPPQNPAATYGLWRARQIADDIDDQLAFMSGTGPCVEPRCQRPAGHSAHHANETIHWWKLV